MTETFDVVVVGFGLAGAIAAIEAHDRGARVLILEKQTVPGGISICAGGGVRIADDADRATEYLDASPSMTGMPHALPVSIAPLAGRRRA
jgi:succinate dehydrogenase/fumarate reductase flavoprotein subunit